MSRRPRAHITPAGSVPNRNRSIQILHLTLAVGIGTTTQRLRRTRGETGRHAWFRSMCPLRAWGFESLRVHHPPGKAGRAYNPRSQKSEVGDQISEVGFRRKPRRWVVCLILQPLSQPVRLGRKPCHEPCRELRRKDPGEEQEAAKMGLWPYRRTARSRGRGIRFDKVRDKVRDKGCICICSSLLQVSTHVRTRH